MASTAARLALAATGLKLALLPAYRSTDFEVHRNWLAVTARLPLREWYTDATSQWTLDYPPLFAWFERGLAVIAGKVAPSALTLQADPVEDASVVVFQRLSVVAVDAALAAAAWVATRHLKSGAGRALSFGLVFASPAILILDHIHFQYNGALCALLLASLAAAARGADALAATLFAILVCAKHLFASLGPLYAAYLLARAANQGSFGAGVLYLTTIATPVAAVVAATLGPFARAGALPALASRLFPFGRGLLHAYWAGNAWALYAAADVAACAAARLVLGPCRAPTSGLAAGLVRDAVFGVLPSPTPAFAAALVVAAQAPALVAAARGRTPSALRTTAVQAALSAFMFGYHVHEKAVLPAVIVAALDAAGGVGGAQSYLRISLPGLHGLLPLLPPLERALGGVLLLAHAAACDAWLPGGLGRGGWATVAALTSLELLCTVVHPLLLAPRLPFAPLAATSVACAIGLTWAWVRATADVVALARGVAAGKPAKRAPAPSPRVTRRRAAAGRA